MTKSRSVGLSISGIDQSHWMFPCRDQGEYSACAGFACEAIAEYYLARQGMELTHDNMLSPSYPWYHFRNWPKGALKGSSIENIRRMFVEGGDCKNNIWPWNEKILTKKPSRQAEDDANKRKIFTGSEELRSHDQMVAALSQGHVLFLAIMKWPKDFEEPDKVFIFRQGFSTQDFKQEGHAMVIVGYVDYRLDNGQTVKAYKVRGSHGIHWKDNGYCYITPKMLDDLDPTVILFKPKNKITSSTARPRAQKGHPSPARTYGDLGVEEFVCAFWLFDDEQAFNYAHKNRLPPNSLHTGAMLGKLRRCKADVNVGVSDQRLKDRSSRGKMVAFGIAQINNTNEWSWTGTKVPETGQDIIKRLKQSKEKRDELQRMIRSVGNDVDSLGFKYESNDPCIVQFTHVLVQLLMIYSSNAQTVRSLPDSYISYKEAYIDAGKAIAELYQFMTGVVDALQKGNSDDKVSKLERKHGINKDNFGEVYHKARLKVRREIELLEDFTRPR